MNNVINMIEYYINHKNADNNIIEYIKNKLNESEMKELIIVQIKLLFSDPSDKVVNGLVNHITKKINNILSENNLYLIADTISKLEVEKKNIQVINKKLEEENKKLIEEVKLHDIEKYIESNETIDECIDRLLSVKDDNLFFIEKNKNELKSIDIWLNNLINSYTRQVNNADIKVLLDYYVLELDLFDRDEYINNYINILSSKIDNIIMGANIIDSITNVMPEIDKFYKEEYEKDNNVFKILDYYIDLLDINIKKKINSLSYEERILLKEKIEIILKDILTNSTPDDDFKALVINSYIKYI